MAWSCKSYSADIVKVPLIQKLLRNADLHRFSSTLKPHELWMKVEFFCTITKEIGVNRANKLFPLHREDANVKSGGKSKSQEVARLCQTQNCNEMSFYMQKDTRLCKYASGKQRQPCSYAYRSKHHQLKPGAVPLCGRTHTLTLLLSEGLSVCVWCVRVCVGGVYKYFYMCISTKRYNISALNEKIYEYISYTVCRERG